MIFVPIYATGTPNDQSDIQDEYKRTIIIALLTLLNISHNEKKLVAIYVIMTISYTVAAFIFMFFYWKMSMDWRYRKHSHREKFLD